MRGGVVPCPGHVVGVNRANLPASGRPPAAVTGARLVARTVRGIEQLVAAEVATIGRVERIRHREVWFTAPLTPAVLSLRTADDVFLVGRVFRGVGHTRADLSRVARAAGRLPVECLLAQRTACGVPPPAPGAEVVASFVGRRNFSRYDLEDAVGAALPGYVSRRRRVPDPGVQSWRLTVVGDEAVLALRVAGRPLHRRPYRTRTVPGSLHPPLAAALVRLAGVAPGMTVLNPCCGAGTLLIESVDASSAADSAGHRLGIDATPAPDTTGDRVGADTCLAGRHPGVDAAPAADSGCHRFGIDAPSATGCANRRLDVAATPPQDTTDHRHGADAPPTTGSANNRLDVAATPAPDSAGDRVGASTYLAGRHRSVDAAPAADSERHRFGSDAPSARNSTSRHLGVDVSPAAVACARENGVRALCVADAGQLPIATGSVDRVLVNPPWEHQVASLGLLADAPARLWESIRRVLRPDGLVAAVVPSVALPGFRVRTSLEVRIAGRSAWLVLASPA